MAAVKDPSQRGMVEVPSWLARAQGLLVFLDEERVAGGHRRRELLQGPSVLVDAGSAAYALVLEWHLDYCTAPLRSQGARLSALSQEHRGDVIEMTLAHLRRAGEESVDVMEKMQARRQLRAMEDLLFLLLERLEGGESGQGAQS